jgi:hypothetical protein
MKSNQPKSTARHSGSAPVSNTASVPLSVYRELAAELQATRAMVDSLNGKTQQLNQENQKLRQEMQRVVQSVLMLQPWVETMPIEASAVPMGKKAQTVAGATWEETAAASAIAAKLRNSAEPPLSDALFTEASASPQQVTQTKPAAKLGNLWLTLTIIVIIVSAFGAGFLIMRPFLASK